MANICEYEIHVKGNKKASLYLYTMIPALDYKKITSEFGTEKEYIIHIKGNCKWSLDSFCEENNNVVIHLEDLSEEDIRNESIGLDYWYLPMREKSKLLGVEIQAHSWSDESEFDQFDHYRNGLLIYSKYNDYSNYYPWDKTEFPTYEAFCKAYAINPQEVPEDSWYEDDEDIFYCDILPTRNISKTKFDF